MVSRGRDSAESPSSACCERRRGRSRRIQARCSMSLRGLHAACGLRLGAKPCGRAADAREACRKTSTGSSPTARADPSPQSCMELRLRAAPTARRLSPKGMFLSFLYLLLRCGRQIPVTLQCVTGRRDGRIRRPVGFSEQASGFSGDGDGVLWRPSGPENGAFPTPWTASGCAERTDLLATPRRVTRAQIAKPRRPKNAGIASLAAS